MVERQMGENPPAFPRDHRHLGHNGMTLRDWFAGQALAGLYAKHGISESQIEALELDARLAFSIADAMLLARTQSLPNTCGEG